MGIKRKDKTIHDLRSELEFTERFRQRTHIELLRQSEPPSTTSDYDALCSTDDFRTETDELRQTTEFPHQYGVWVIEQFLVYNQTQILPSDPWNLLSSESKDKQRYKELLEASKRKQFLITDLKSYIGSLKKQLSTKLTNFDEESIICSHKELNSYPFSKLFQQQEQNLALMSGKKFNQGNNVLPPIPNGNFHNQPRNRNSELVNGKNFVEMPSAVKENNTSLYNGEKVSNNVDEMRRNIMRLNSDLLRKSIEINRLEDELREAVRKTDKVKESYRDSVSKNESFEEEITMNRKRIEEIQERHKSYELKENQYKRDIANLQLSLQQSKEKYKGLEEENNLLKIDIGVNAATSQKICDLENENKHWKRNVAILEKEIQTLSGNMEMLKDEIGLHKNELIATKKRLLHAEKDRDTMKSATHLQQREVEDVVQENEQLKFEIAEKMRISDKLDEQLRRAQQNEDHINMKCNQTEMNMKRMERKLTHSEEQNVNLQEQVAKLTETVKENQIAQMNFNSEREMAVRGTSTGICTWILAALVG